MFNRVLAFAALLAATACSNAETAAPSAAGIQEGRDYVVLPTPQPTSAPGKIEVVEVFGYWCIHCAHLDPTVTEWKKTSPDDVAFRYMPAVFSGGVDEFFARAFYTAETMGVLDKTHSDMFKAAAVDRKIKSPDDIVNFYAERGVDREAFQATMNSFAVNAKIARTKQTLPGYALEGTPGLIVNGKYRVLNSQGGWDKTMAVVDQLIEMERRSQKGG
ncbi:thiol:disulfide interchange protein DsbA/DsbL [Pseudomarimonas arenosa]|uniref:Thiol:disulfide interchange protein n=1 Tax=Pseudomarimonas arenosa TaxID=2774145 RepID=A0AAW3ZJK4_9GAMM|nr:thiol:disulfide interchange protein DsbA/DsbL [Pseudomarimonas arenosa]MBD8525694.1 thiol:disulfide interchange protein DsbA/DsbL [Pseudomarimonas arenosa]